MKSNKKQPTRFFVGIGYGWYAERKQDLATLKAANLDSNKAVDTEAEAKAYAAEVLAKTGVKLRIGPSY